MTIRFFSQAKQEFVEAVQYYKNQSLELGSDFVECFDLAVRDIQENPERWPKTNQNCRRRLLKRFPYCLVYRIYPDEVVVVATMHLSRDPNYWVDRI